MVNIDDLDPEIKSTGTGTAGNPSGPRSNQAPPPQYPRDRKDHKFFVLHFMDALYESGALQTIGGDGFALLMHIVRFEDKHGYKKAVYYSPIDLCKVLGISNSTLKRVRTKCVEQGYLTHLPGRQANMGTYWVCGLVDEDGYWVLDRTPSSTGQIDTLDEEPTAQNDTLDDVQGPFKDRSRTAQGVNLTRTSYLGPLTADITPPSGECDRSAAASPGEDFDNDLKKKKTKNPAKGATDPEHSPDHIAARRMFRDAWRAKYGADYPWNFGKDDKHLKILLDLAGSLAEFEVQMGRFLACTSKFHSVESCHSLANWFTHQVKYSVAAPTTAPTGRQDAPPRDRSGVYDDGEYHAPQPAWPPHLDTPEMRDAWQAYDDAKHRMGRPITESYRTQMCALLSQYTAKVVLDVIRAGVAAPNLGLKIPDRAAKQSQNIGKAVIF